MTKRTKHTHRYAYQRLSKFNTGWRCMKDYCDHFLPRNVEDTIEGRMSECWGCSEDFKLDEEAIKMEMPYCPVCRLRESGGPSPADLAAHFERQLALAKAGVKDESELTPQQRATMKALGIPLREPDEPEKDEIEVIEPTEDDNPES